MGVGGWRKQKVPIELRRHFETNKEGRPLHIINGSVYYRVTYSQASLVSPQLRIRLPKQEMWVRKIPSRRKWPPTRVFLPGNSHGQRSRVGYSAWGRKRVRHDWATKQQQLTLRVASGRLQPRSIHSCTLHHRGGNWYSSAVNLEGGSQCLGKGLVFLSQYLWMGSNLWTLGIYISKGFHHCLGTNRA